MRKARSAFTVTTIAVTATALLASPASAAYGDNFVQAHATAGQRVVERSNVMVVVNDTDTVDNGNLAEAYAHDCTGCRAVAVAFQVVLIPGSPHTVTPGNLALAVNERCASCTSIAIAKQILVYSHGASGIDADAREEVADLNRQVREIATSAANAAQMDAQLAPLFDQLVATVNDSLDGPQDDQRSEHASAA